MPRYLVDMHVSDGPDASGSFVAQRFPEIAVEHRYSAHDQIGWEVWVCRAPSVAHIERWVEASPLALRSLQRIDESHTRSSHAPGTNSGGTARRKEP